MGVWLGNDDNSPTGQTSAVAAGLWRDIMKTAGPRQRRCGGTAMKRTRLWLILGGLLVVVVVLSIVMQAINSLIWQLSYWLPGWLVGPILLLLVGALVLALLPLVEPWIRGKRGQAKAGQPAPPSSRQEAARRNLDSIDQQLAQLSDDVARQALQQQRQQVQESLERGISAWWSLAAAPAAKPR